MPTPTKKQWIGYALENTGVNPTLSHVRLPNPSAAGDTIIIVGQYGSGSDIISSIVDDQSNTWTKDKTQADVGNGQSIVILRASNVAANTRVVTINFTGATGFTQFSGILLNNIATSSPVDATAGQTTSGTSISCGNITTTQADDFLVFFAIDDSGASITSLTTFKAQADWALFAPDGMAESCGQYGVQPTAATIAPAITTSRSFSSAIAACVAYKTATAGSGPSSTIEVQTVQHVSFNGYKANFGGSTFTFNVPCEPTINTINVAHDDGNDLYISMQSNPSNSWISTAPIKNALTIRHVYAQSALVSREMTVTLAISAVPTPTTNPFLIAIYGMSNGGVMDTYQSGSGNLASVPPVTQNNVLTTALTTAQANEVIILYVQQVQQSITGIVATTGTALPLFIDCGQYESLVGCNDGGPAIVNAASPASYNFNVSYSNYEGGLQVSNWAAQAIAFKTVVNISPLGEDDGDSFQIRQAA